MCSALNKYIIFTYLQIIMIVPLYLGNIFLEIHYFDVQISKQTFPIKYKKLL